MSVVRVTYAFIIERSGGERTLLFNMLSFKLNLALCTGSVSVYLYIRYVVPVYKLEYLKNARSRAERSRIFAVVIGGTNKGQS